MNIHYIEPRDPRALLELHGQEMSDSLSQSMEFSNSYFLLRNDIFKSSDPNTSFCILHKNLKFKSEESYLSMWNLNVATFRAHLLQTYEDSDYPNYNYKCCGESTIQSLPCEKRLCLQSTAHTIVRVQKALSDLYSHNRRGQVGFNPKKYSIAWYSRL